MPPDFVYALPPAGIFLLILLVTGSIAAVFHRLLSSPRAKRLNERLADLSPVVITLCGTLFVLSVTFLANVVWTAEDRARETVNAEARSIRVINGDMAAMAAPERDGLTRLVAEYAQAVSAEWPAMPWNGGSPAAEQELKDLYDAVMRGFAEGDQNRMIQQRLLVALDQLSAARQQRLSMAQDVVSGGQWFLVTMLGLLLLVVVSLGHGRFPLPRTVALAAISFAISVALSVIVSHDRPFVGYAALTPQPIMAAAGL